MRDKSISDEKSGCLPTHIGKSAKRAAFKTCKPIVMKTTTLKSLKKKSLEALCILKF